jgi:hypothetical protein
MGLHVRPVEIMETIEVIHTTDYGKISRYKTHSRDPIKEALEHINDKYLQNDKISEEIKKV